MFKWWEPILALVLVALFFAAPGIEWECPFKKIPAPNRQDTLEECRAKRRYYPRGRLVSGLPNDAIDEKGLAWLEAAYDDDQGQAAREWLAQERLRKLEH